MSDAPSIATQFKQWQEQDPEMAFAMGAIRALTEVIKASKAETMMGLQKELDAATASLTKAHVSISLNSGAALFLRYVTRAYDHIPDFQQCKLKLIERGEQLKKRTNLSRNQISKLAESFVRDGAVVLTHGFSRVVCAVLIAAAEQEKRFRVIITESRPEANGIKTAERLLAHKIPVTLIPDTTVAYIMDQVDMVMSGAEAVVESGGIINKVGTYQVAVVAKALNKPFYVTAESFKMTRLFPLGQSEIPNRQGDMKVTPSKGSPNSYGDLNIENPSLDYTPPKYITLLFTDLGALTPSAVSDELIKLYPLAEEKFE